DKIPPVEIADKVVEYCGITPEQLTLVLTPTTSLAGSMQVVGRVLEVALHKAHELGFPLDDIVDGTGAAPLCPPGSDFLTAMGRTNDAILFGGQVHLFVAGDEAAAADLARQLPSATSDDFGRPFAEVFKATGYDFYKIDPMLFSPARVAVTALETGRTFHAGELREDLLDTSFGSGD
ncbi:MAG: methenyltetrahydromethanopterin cyclohydrolase, partial [Gammaproteobacteria bacterium]|nr:methenyltetrahydromethanopterin cyclohydrolase [Gammaproteobacteria bacterium]